MESGSTITGAGYDVHVSVKGGTFTMNGGTISESSGGGVGVENNGIFTLKSGTISGNTSREAGGGVSVSNATFNMEGGNIQGNTAGEPDMSSYGRGGGGVYVDEAGVFNMSSGTIAYNTARSYYNSYGGGVHVFSAGNFNMTDGLITGNTCTSDTDPSRTYGGGVYIANGGTFTKIGGGTIDDTNSAQHGKVACLAADAYHEAPAVRNTTVAPSDDMNSGIAGINGGWE